MKKSARIRDGQFIKHLDKSFSVPLPEMKRIMKAFRLEMERGLRGESSSLKMIPTYVDVPTGGERGKFLALDLGGTNFRVLELELKCNGKTAASRAMNFVLPKDCLTGTADELFDFLAACVKKFLAREKLNSQQRLGLGFTFSFPVYQTGVAAGTLGRWTKGFDVKSVVGEDVVGLLTAALARQGLGNIHVAALVNDTVGTLVARSYEDSSCDVGVILGTGTNACYREELSKIPKWKGPAAPDKHMIVNIEWGNFNKLRRTRYDEELDLSSDRPGEQILEKMVSGLYLGEAARLALKDLVKGDKFAKKLSLTAKEMSGIESSRSAGPVKKVCGLVSRRASRVSAAAIAAIVTKMDPALSRNHTIAIDGALYEKHPHFAKNISSGLKELLGPKSSRIKMALTKDGSGKGAAIIAAVVSRP